MEQDPEVSRRKSKTAHKMRNGYPTRTKKIVNGKY